jgi:CDP-glucose 4,6-dehydratase
VRDPPSIRPWQFVLEPLSGILLLAMKMLQEPHKFSEPWNFGPINFTNKVNVEQIVELVIKEWNSGKWIDASGNFDARYESASLILDPSKAFNLLKWKTIYSLDETIHETILWYKKYFENKIEIKEYSIQQIKNYCKKAQEMNMVWATN